MDNLDGGDGPTTGLELSHAVLDHSFNSRDEMEGSSEWSDVLNSGGSANHEMIPVGHCDLGISQSEQDVSELNLLWVLTSLTHDLVQDNSLLECLVGCSPLVGELTAGVSSVERKVHDWRKLAKVSEEKTGASCEHFLGMVKERPGEDVCPLGLGSSFPP